MIGLPGRCRRSRSDATGHPINRAFADMEFDKPEIECEPGFEGQIHAINLFDHIARADITWNPSFTAITGACICCVTSEEHMLPVIHGNDRNEWFIQLTDEIHWQIADKNTGNPRGRIVMKSGDVCAMPADIRHQGFAPKRSMLMVLENGTPGLRAALRLGRAGAVPDHGQSLVTRSALPGDLARGDRTDHDILKRTRGLRRLPRHGNATAHDLCLALWQ